MSREVARHARLATIQRLEVFGEREKADGYAEYLTESYGLECLVEPEQNVAHYEVLNRMDSAPDRPQPRRASLIERALRLAVPTGLW